MYKQIGYRSQWVIIPIGTRAWNGGQPPRAQQYFWSNHDTIRPWQERSPNLWIWSLSSICWGHACFVELAFNSTLVLACFSLVMHVLSSGYCVHLCLSTRSLVLSYQLPQPLWFASIWFPVTVQSWLNPFALVCSSCQLLCHVPVSFVWVFVSLNVAFWTFINFVFGWFYSSLFSFYGLEIKYFFERATALPHCVPATWVLNNANPWQFCGSFVEMLPSVMWLRTFGCSLMMTDDTYFAWLGTVCVVKQLWEKNAFVMHISLNESKIWWLKCEIGH